MTQRRGFVSEAPPLDGEGSGWGDVCECTQYFIDSTPTQPSPIKGEGL
jgi:hypothetical protein